MENLKITWKKPHASYAYFAGDQAELPADKVSELVDSGYVILFPGEEEKEENPLPEGLPFRDLLNENGFNTIEQILLAGDELIQIKGITAKTVDKIIRFITDNK